jgi:hypothetical protein
MKKIIVFLIAAFCLCLANKTMAQTGSTGSCTWTITGTSGNYTLTISGNGAMGTYTSSTAPWDSYRSNIKTLVIQQGVTSIGDYAFYNCSGLTSVTIPNSVTSIGERAFYSCSGLTSVSIPNSVTSISNYAFYFCSGLTSVTIPNSVTSISNYAFRNCSNLTTVNFNATHCTTMGSSSSPVFSGCSSLSTLTIGNNVQNIPASAFYGCSSLTSVIIPNSVTTIDNSAFQNCSSLTTVNFNATNCTSMETSVFSGCSSFSTLTIGNNVQNIPTYAFYGCSSLTSVIISNSVTTIGNFAFYNCSGLTSVTILNSVTSIGDYAFYGCNGLTSVTIPNSVTSIGYYAFRNTPWFNNQSNGVIYINNVLYAYKGTMPNGTTINIQGGTISISPSAFYNCSGLISVTIPNSVTSIGDSAFYNCSGLTSVSIPNSVTSIGASAFYNCSGLTSVTIPHSVTSIGASAFYNCTNLSVVNFNASNCTTMGSSSSPVFGGCSSFSILNIGNNVQTIPAYAFYGRSGISFVAIPDSVTTIGNYAFYGCSSLYSIAIPPSVNYLGGGAFRNCTGLNAVYFNARNCTVGTYIENSNYYSPFSNSSTSFTLNIGDSVQNINDDAFRRSNISSLNISNSVTSIGNYAFQYCSKLTSVTISNSVATIGSYAFQSCSNLTSLTIGNSVTSIGQSALGDCTNLDTVYFNAINCATMGITVFSNCSSFRTLIIGNNVKNIPQSGFRYCSVLTGTLIIPNSVMSIGDLAFNGCTGFTSVTIPDSLTTLGQSAFGNCTGLATVSFNAINCTNIGAMPFSGCTTFKTLHIGNKVQQILDNTFAFSGLTSMTVRAINPPQIYSNTFNSVPTTIPVTVPCNRVSAYQAASTWSNFSNIQDSALFLVTVQSSDSSKGTAILTQSPCPSNQAIVEAVANTGYQFVQWNDGNTTNPRSLTLTSNITLTAEFAQSPLGTYYVAVSTANPSMGAVSGSGNYTQNTTATVGAIANAGYSFVQWNDGNTQNPRTFTLTQDTTFIATFGVSAPNTYHVTVSSDNATMGAVTGNGDYAKNSILSVGAVANPGYSFVQWNDGNVQNPRSITLTKDTNFTATFSVSSSNTYHVTVSSNSIVMGAVTGNGNYAKNSVLSVGAIANTGYQFVQWNDGSTDNPRSITLTKDTIFVATFAISASNTYHVTVSSNNTTMGAVTGSGDYAKNSVLSVGAIANTGYHFVQWNDGITTNPRSITLTQDTNFTATFVSSAQTTYSVNILSNSSVMGSITGNGNYSANNTVTIAAIPNAGYQFVQWNDGNTNNPRTFTITQDTTLIATFSIFVPSSHYVTVSANNPVMGSVSGSGNYNSNSNVSIAAIANTGYYFVQWNDGSTNNPRTITLTKDTNFTATFAVSAPNTYHVTASSNQTSMGAVSGSGDYTKNSVVIIGAIANAGYSFTQWNDGNTTNPRTFTLTKDTNFTATFAVLPPNTNHVTVSTNNINMGSITGSGDYTKNSIITIGAIANTGYSFVQWNDGNTTNPRTFTLTKDTNFTATFAVSAPNTYHLTASSNQTIMGSVSGSGDYAKNSVVTIGAIANTGYSFVQWNDGNTTNPRTFTLTKDTNFTATFAVSASNTYHLTVSTNNANMGSVTGNGDYAKNSVVTIGAIANTGYSFVQWSDGNTTNPRSITLTSDILFTAIFSVFQNTYHLTASSNQSIMGSVSGSGDYAKNSIVAIGAIANTGYSFVQWNDGITNNPRTFTLTKDTNFVATFAVLPPNTNHVTVSTNNTNMGSVTGSGDYTKNSVVTIGAIANTGYSFIQWNDGNTNNPRSFTLTKDTNFTATFAVSAPNTYHLTASSNQSIMGTISGSGDYAKNSIVTIGAIANAGYSFVQWNDGITNNPRTFTLTKDTNFVATFAVSAPNTYHVTASSNQSIMGSVSGSGDYAQNSVVTIGAIANAGYSFVQWNDGITINPRTFTLTKDTSFTATFAVLPPNTNHVTVSTNNTNMGSVTGNGDYTKNSVVTIGAIANTGYSFIQWNDGNTNNPRSFTLTKDTNFMATFAISAPNTYHATISSDNAGMGLVAGSGDYAKNSVVTIGAIANTGYSFVQWNDGNTQNPRSFTLTSDTAFKAIFETNVDIKAIKATSDISVYPNPATDYINIHLPDNVYQAVFTLYDMQSKLLLQQEISNQDVISVNTFAKGVYIYNITTDKEKHVGKLIIDN